MTQLVLELEEINGKFTILIGTKTPPGATVTIMEKVMANHIMTGLNERLGDLMGAHPISTVVANTGDGALNQEIVDAARAKFMREQG